MKNFVFNSPRLLKVKINVFVVPPQSSEKKFFQPKPKILDTQKFTEKHFPYNIQYSLIYNISQPPIYMLL